MREESAHLFDCGDVGILMYAVISNEVHVVEELLKVSKRDFNEKEYTRRLESRVREEGYTALGIPGGTFVFERFVFEREAREF